MRYDVVMGLENGRTEIAACEDEARALAISALLTGQTGGDSAWFKLRPDANGERLSIRLGGHGPLQSIRIRQRPDETPPPATSVGSKSIESAPPTNDEIQ